MIEKLPKPIRFDKDVDVLVVSRDGEKFFVTADDPSLPNPKLKTLLEWAILTGYPLRKFVKAQRVLSAKFFGV